MPDGVATAAADAIDQLGDIEEMRADLAQLALFEDLGTEHAGSLDSPSPLSKAHPLADLVAKRGKGRPKGSQNRSTVQVRAWFLSQHRHPLLVMGEAYSMSPVDLAGRIGIAEPTADMLFDLFKLQMHMAEVTATYVAQRQPQAVEVSSRQDFVLRVDAGVSLPARGGVAGNSDAIEGVVGVLLPPKSDG